MPDAADMAARHREILTELAELGMALARDVQGRALAAADDHAKAELTLAFHRTSRSVRQTLALEARLEREQRLSLREDASEAARRTVSQVMKKRGQVRAAVSRLIWTEAEGDEAEALLEDLEARLIEQETLDEDAFLAAPLEACVERIVQDLHLAAANGAIEGDAYEDDGGEPPGDTTGEPVTVTIWKSSG